MEAFSFRATLHRKSWVFFVIKFYIYYGVTFVLQFDKKKKKVYEKRDDFNFPIVNFPFIVAAPI